MDAAQNLALQRLQVCLIASSPLLEAGEERGLPCLLGRAGK
jgi:hypothetical protein